jgi:hypothetical protein
MTRSAPNLCIVLLTICVLIPPTASVADDNANYLVTMFNKACIPNIGRSAEVKKWAEDHHLPVITSPAALQLFVGDNTTGEGVAWDISTSALGRFALSIRGLTQACTVYAEKADAAAVESMFTKEVVGATRPGIEVRKDSEKKADSHFGVAKQLIYIVTATGNTERGYELILTTVEHPGGAFQASLQVAGTFLNH